MSTVWIRRLRGIAVAGGGGDVTVVVAEVAIGVVVATGTVVEPILLLLLLLLLLLVLVFPAAAALDCLGSGGRQGSSMACTRGFVSSVAVKAITVSVLPSPIQCATMQPLPCTPQYSNKINTTVSTGNRTIQIHSTAAVIVPSLQSGWPS